MSRNYPLLPKGCPAAHMACSLHPAHTEHPPTPTGQAVSPSSVSPWLRDLGRPLSLLTYSILTGQA